MLARLERVRRIMAEKQIDALLVSNLSNCRYLSGFTGSTAFLLITPDASLIAVDSRYSEQASRECPSYQVEVVKGGIAEWFPSLAAKSGMTKWAVESTSISLATYQALADAIGREENLIQLIPSTELIEASRAIKEPAEAELIIQSAALADRGFDFIIKEISVGMTEQEVAWRLERFLRDHDSETIPFQIIVASGPNAAMPHAHPGERTIGIGEPVVIDFGARIHGYCCDITRTVCVGDPDPILNKLHSIVLGAQLTALSTIHQGMTGQQADELARVVINEAGYGDNFGHGLGHGIGLDIHEPPRIGSRSVDVLVEGMVFSIEPGIYLPGWGGVRIEDTVLMGDNILKVLTKSSKSLKVK